MKRTIPLFRALIAADPEKRYHQNYAHLGYALKDQQEPDYHEAEAMLTEAIRIRGDWRVTNFVIYEFNRALCRIHQDAAFEPSRQPAADNVREPILEDLRAVAHDAPQLIQHDELCNDWMEVNGLGMEDLRNQAISSKRKPLTAKSPTR